MKPLRALAILGVAAACGGQGGPSDQRPAGNDPVWSSTDSPGTGTERPPSTLDPSGSTATSCTCPLGTYQCGPGLSIEITSTGGVCSLLGDQVLIDPCSNTFTEGSITGTISIASGAITFCTSAWTPSCLTCTR